VNTREVITTPTLARGVWRPSHSWNGAPENPPRALTKSNVKKKRRWLLALFFVLECSCWLHIVCCDVLADWVWCIGMFLLTDYGVLEYPYWLNSLYWNVLTDWIVCTGMSLLTE
jgi:hypothetical protein